jgi:hypothetical protein
MLMGQSITKNAVLLALFAMSTALLLAGSYLLTTGSNRRGDPQGGGESAAADRAARTPRQFNA